MEEEIIPLEVEEEATVAKLTINRMIEMTINMFVLAMRQGRLPRALVMTNTTVTSILTMLTSERNALSIQLTVSRTEPERKEKHWLGVERPEVEEDAVLQEMTKAIKHIMLRRWMKQMSTTLLLEARTMMNSLQLKPKTEWKSMRVSHLKTRNFMNCTPLSHMVEQEPRGMLKPSRSMEKHLLQPPWTA
jgi:hypothetical protein